MKSNQILEGVKRRASNKAERANQKRDRAGDATADGGVHAIEHTVRRSRKQEAAAAKHVVKPPRRRWQRASTLPAMPELPGYHLEYVRRDNRNRGDHANLLAHIRSGWETCKVTDFDDDNLPTVQIAKHGDVIGNDDTILMKIHEDLWAEREAEYAGARDLATKAINVKTPKLDVQHRDFPFYKDDMKNVHSSKHQQVGIRRRGQVADDTDD